MDDPFICLIRLDQAPLPKTTCACERVTFGDTAEVIVQLSFSIGILIETKMSLFQPNFGGKKHISRDVSPFVAPTSPQVTDLVIQFGTRGCDGGLDRRTEILT
jgi:hypothetical protein